MKRSSTRICHCARSSSASLQSRGLTSYDVEHTLSVARDRIGDLTDLAFGGEPPPRGHQYAVPPGRLRQCARALSSQHRPSGPCAQDARARAEVTRIKVS